MNCALKALNIADNFEIYHLLQRIPKNENGFQNNINGVSYEDFKAWLVRAEAASKQKEIEDGWKVPLHIYWFYVDGRPVGMGKLRCILTDRLRQEGGNIGYAIIPEERNKGYGSLLLSALLKKAGEMGMDKVLATVKNDNIASIRAALSNGGKIDSVNELRHFIWFSLDSHA